MPTLLGHSPPLNGRSHKHRHNANIGIIMKMQVNSSHRVSSSLPRDLQHAHSERNAGHAREDESIPSRSFEAVEMVINPLDQNAREFRSRGLAYQISRPAEIEAIERSKVKCFCISSASISVKRRRASHCLATVRRFSRSRKPSAYWGLVRPPWTQAENASSIPAPAPRLFAKVQCFQALSSDR